MDLRKVRIQLTAIYTVLSALSIGIIALYAVNAGRDRLLRSAERDVVQQHTSVLLALNAGETDFDDDAWVVSLVDGSSRPLADTNVEPPLRTLAQRAGGASDVELEQFTYDNQRYLAATKKLSADEENKQYLITAVNIDSYYDEANSLRTRIWLAAVGLTALCGGVGYLFAKRSLEPAHRAMIARQPLTVTRGLRPLGALYSSCSRPLNSAPTGARGSSFFLSR